jgi:hypothetical protein
MDSQECAPKINVVVHGTNEEDNKVLPPWNWKGVME